MQPVFFLSLHFISWALIEKGTLHPRCQLWFQSYIKSVGWLILDALFCGTFVLHNKSYLTAFEILIKITLLPGWFFLMPANPQFECWCLMPPKGFWLNKNKRRYFQGRIAGSLGEEEDVWVSRWEPHLCYMKYTRLSPALALSLSLFVSNHFPQGHYCRFSDHSAKKTFVCIISNSIFFPS